MIVSVINVEEKRIKTKREQPRFPGWIPAGAADSLHRFNLTIVHGLLQIHGYHFTRPSGREPRENTCNGRLVGQPGFFSTSGAIWDKAEASCEI